MPFHTNKNSLSQVIMVAPTSVLMSKGSVSNSIIPKVAMMGCTEVDFFLKRHIQLNLSSSIKMTNFYYKMYNIRPLEVFTFHF